MSEKYLISISIGPVQDFIASARRSRDLWFGSWLLSELSKAAAKAIGEKNLIFPNASASDLEPNSPYNVVNKILAEVSDKPEIVCKKVKDAIDERLRTITDKAFQGFGNLPKQLIDLEKARLQVSDVVEFFWTAVEHSDPKKYKLDRNKVEKIFSARKATRNFHQVSLSKSDKQNNWGDNVPKSSLDGQRESVILEKAYDEFKTKGNLRIRLGVKEGERLCGVGLLKRHGKVEKKDENYQDCFFSTSHVASLPILERLKKQKNYDETTRYKEKISDLLNEIANDDLYKIVGRVPKNLKHEVFGEYDGHLLFAERLSEFFDNEAKLKSAKNELRKFLDDVLGKNKEPLPYYALVLADGDFMGKAIDNQKTIKDHQDLSGKLSEFAGEVGKIIEKDGQGSLIYSGGDDVLAFVGLHKVLEYADKLAKDFESKLKKFDFVEKGEKKTPTLSVGIAVVHHLEPLEDALELVRRAERAAKSVDGKNALAVVVDKRSGASRIAKGTWGTLDKRLQTFIKWHRENSIPDGAAYELRDLAYRLEIPENAPEALRKNLTEAKEKEAKRILKRKKKDFGESAIDDETIKSLEQFIKDIEKTKQPDEDSIAILADELIIAKIFADAEDLALMEIKK